MRPMIPISARGLRMGFGLDPWIRRRVHVTPWASKFVTEKISELADKANKKVGEGLATAIETGEKVTEKTKKTLGTTTKLSKGKAEGAKGGADQMKQGTKEVVAGAKEAGKKQKDL